MPLFGSIAKEPCPMTPSADAMTLIACGALARDIRELIAISGLEHIHLTCLPATLHNRPERIPAAVESAILKARAAGAARIAVAYADCGTGGLLDTVLSRHGVRRIEGPHCYAFYSGLEAFAARQETDLRAFFVTDFLVRQFDTLVIEPLGLDRHPDLHGLYFGAYEKLVYLAQTDDKVLAEKAEAAAQRLNLTFEHRFVGYGMLADFVEALG